MILTDYLLSTPSLQWQYALQAGVSHAVIRLPEDGGFDEASPAHWQSLYNRFCAKGLRPVVVEPMPPGLHGHIKAGDGQRDESIERVIQMMKAMDKVGVRIICTNFMCHIGWYRTAHNLQERGGALVTGFNADDAGETAFPPITRAQLWANYTYFVRAVTPYAERYGIRLALHPDDPPVERLGGVERIFTSL
ncbi:MAG: mannonate dehydratase, partial [Oscillospiraceae bacterium]